MASVNGTEEEGRPRGTAPLRVAHLTTIDMSLWWLLRTELEVDREAGFEVYGISAPGPFVSDLEALGLRHVSVPALTRAWNVPQDVAATRQLARVLSALRLDVLHTHTPKAGVLGRLLGRAARIPVVVNTCHGLWAQPDDSLVRRMFVYGAELLAGQVSDLELYQNDADRQTLRRGIRQRKARTVGNGVDLRRFIGDPEARARIRAELGVEAGDVLVGGVGRLVREKGILEFGQAAGALAERATFVWVGPADTDEPDAPAVAEGVRLLGQRDDMPAVYAALDVFVLPSYREGFSRSAMEAAASGCALVLSDIRGCRELGRHGEHVLLVPPGDAAALSAAIVKLLDDRPLRAHLAATAQDRAFRDFDQHAVARSSLAAYRDAALRKRLPIARDLAAAAGR